MGQKEERRREPTEDVNTDGRRGAEVSKAIMKMEMKKS